MSIRRIHSKGSFRQEEAIAAGTISPGDLIQLDSNGNVVVHNTDGGYAEKAFAQEDQLQGNTVNDDYVVDSIVTYLLPVQGSEVNALIKAGETIAIGDKLISGADGTLIEDASAAGTVQEIVAVAVEANNLSASAAVNTLSAVRIV